MTDHQWLTGHPAILVGEADIVAYPGDDIADPEHGPVAAYVFRGDGYSALVVHDPEATTFIASPEGGVLAQLICAPDRDVAVQALAARMPTDGWTDLNAAFDLKGGHAVLFDAYYSGADLADADARLGMADMGVTPVKVPLSAGRYQLHARTGFKPSPDTEWTLIALRRLS